MRRLLLRTAAAATTAVLAVLLPASAVADPRPASLPPCAGGSNSASDFDGDGIPDLVVGDPDAAVGGAERAGRVTVVYGGETETTVLEQGQGAVPGEPEPGDRFGEVLDTFDHDQDGCTDLVVGLPFETVNGRAEAGMVMIVYGSVLGLGWGAPTEVWTQDTPGFGGAPEAGDWFGHSVAAGHTLSGEPYMVIGVPGESIGTTEQAGYVQYVRGSTTAAFHQDTDGIPGEVEVQDRYGYEVAANGIHFTVGVPGEAIGAEDYAGGVNFFSHTMVDGRPRYLRTFHQDSTITGLSGDIAEAGDRTGTSIDMIDVIPSEGTDPESLIAIGSPGEDLGTTSREVQDTGFVHVFRMKADATLEQIYEADLGSTDADARQDGAFFGQRVRLVDTAPGSTATGTSVKLVVGAPGHGTGSERASGLIQVHHPLGSDPSQSFDVARADHTALGPVVPGAYLGMSFGVTADDLYVATAFDDGDPGAVHAAPWNGLEAGSADWRTWRPGQDGVPEGGRAFGAGLL